MPDASNSPGVHKLMFLVCMVAYAVVVGALFVYTIRHRHTTDSLDVLLTMWLSSIFPMFIVGTILEGRQLSDILSVKHQSWAFIFGDSIFLPLAGAMFVLALRRQTLGYQLVDRWWWVAVSATVGVAAGFVFHAMDRGSYNSLRFNSPTKLIHDFVAYPLLFGGLLFLGGSVLVNLFQHGHRGLSFALVGIVVGLGGWVALGVAHDSHL